MSNFTITIEAHEICEAIKALAGAMLSSKAPTTLKKTVKTVSYWHSPERACVFIVYPGEEFDSANCYELTKEGYDELNALYTLKAAAVTAPIQPAPAPVVLQPTPTPAPVPTTVPTTVPAAAAAPAPIQTPPPAIPITVPTYTKEQLAIAATQLMDANRRGELVALLKSFNVPALTMLPPDQYGAFATALRELGAKI